MVSDEFLEFWGDFRAEMDELWSVALRSAGEERPIGIANITLAMTVLFSAERHPEWAASVASCIREGLGEIDPKAVRDLEINADLLASINRAPGC